VLKALGTLACALATLLAMPARAQQPPPAGIRGELLGRLDDAATKLDQLAAAIPQEKYGWRPGPGVRSVSEVLMHVGGNNYLLLTFVGIESPVALDDRLEGSLTDRERVTEFLRRSFERVRAALRALPDADLDRAASMLGRPTTYRNVYLGTVTHAHEHLGQLIAYARVNGIAPPWSGGDR
jgi:uncharacterized damage-inducible protein DinB